MLTLLFLLVAGEPAPVELAITNDKSICEALARILNAAPDKPKELKFGCYERAPIVKS